MSMPTKVTMDYGLWRSCVDLLSIILSQILIVWICQSKNREPVFEQQMESSVVLSGDETSMLDTETSSSSVSSSTTVSTQSSGKARKPPKILQISPPALLVTASDFSPMNLCSPSLPTASLTPAMLQVSSQKRLKQVVSMSSRGQQCFRINWCSLALLWCLSLPGHAIYRSHACVRCCIKCHSLLDVIVLLIHCLSPSRPARPGHEIQLMFSLFAACDGVRAASEVLAVVDF